MTDSDNDLRLEIRRGGGMCRYMVTGNTAQAVKEWADGLLKRYEPMGYGTMVSEPGFNEKTGLWCVTAARSLSAGG